MGRRRAVIVVSLFVALSAAAAARVDPIGEAEVPDVLISRQLAEDLDIQDGASIRLSADSTGANAREFHVAGIYEPTPDPMRINASKHEARMHLSDLEAITADPKDPFSVEEVDAINVALADPADDQAFARDVMARVPGVLARPARGASGEAQTFVVLERFHLAIAIITILAS